jgi:chemotaxis protein methyltransferase CheR
MAGHVGGGCIVNIEHFKAIARLLKERSGLVLAEDQAYLLSNRLLPVICKWKLDGIGDIVRAIADRSEEALARDVVEAMTTSDTFFFRDREVFAHIRDAVLPNLLRTPSAADPIRIWSAACSTGQEAYSLAMIVHNLAPDAAARVAITGTDVSTESLARAREGIYSQFEVQRGLPVRLLLRHFAQLGERWQIQPALRAKVMFRNFNLLSDPAPLGRFDIVLCRNVLSYFDGPTQARVLERLARCIAPEGLLCLGADEAALGRDAGYRQIAGQPCIFTPEAPGAFLSAAAGAA